MEALARPVGGPVLTRPYKLLLALCAVGAGLLVWRFAAGLGAVTALNDGYPWGLWIAFDVVTGTALASGGFAMALLVYIFNKGKYHPLVRPAILTSALGYSMAGLAIAIDVGRPWLIWKIPLEVGRWNLNSVLLEVALCMLAYTLVLWIELSPAFLERWRESTRPGLRRFAEKSLPVLDRALLWVLAAGILLPSMHQSSLGTLMLLTGPRLHPLWNTPILPLLFLTSTLAMGYGTVVFETTLASYWYGLRTKKDMLLRLRRVAIAGSLLFVVLRLADLAVRGDLGHAVRPGLHAGLFWMENALFCMPLVLALLWRSPRAHHLFLGAIALAGAGALFRFDTYLVAFDPGPGWSYFPSVGEILITCSIILFQIAIYIAVVKKFPILAGVDSAPPRIATPEPQPVRS